jgi:hypothetical protein
VVRETASRRVGNRRGALRVRDAPAARVVERDRRDVGARAQDLARSKPDRSLLALGERAAHLRVARHLRQGAVGPVDVRLVDGQRGRQPLRDA